MTEIDEKTKIPISLLVTIVTLAFGVGIAWAQISELRSKQETYMDIEQKIDRRLSRIEGKLGVISE